ncbi:MAG TPA: hypothetical protein VF214_05950 [Edaphobacter sp.]
MDVEHEIRELKRRVDELEGSFTFLTTQVKAVHKDVLKLQEDVTQWFIEVGERFDRVDASLAALPETLASRWWGSTER